MVYVSERAPDCVAEYLRGRGNDVTIVTAGIAGGAVASHADLHMCSIGGRLIFKEDGEPGDKYPENAAFCAVALDRYFIHNLKITSPRLLSAAESAGLTKVHVNQGYTKCSCAVVDGRSIITSDNGIIKALEPLGDVDVLRISPGHIALPGHEYGFIGGACGRVDDELVFCGDISAHPDFGRISDFARKRGVRLKWFDFPLTDIGTIMHGL